MCLQSNADTYVSGPSAKDYIDTKLFSMSGVNVEFKSYSNYKEYEQLWGAFHHNVSIIDLLFNCGPNK